MCEPRPLFCQLNMAECDKWQTLKITNLSLWLGSLALRLWSLNPPLSHPHKPAAHTHVFLQCVGSWKAPSTRMITHNCVVSQASTFPPTFPCASVSSLKRTPTHPCTHAHVCHWCKLHTRPSSYLRIRVLLLPHNCSQLSSHCKALALMAELPVLTLMGILAYFQCCVLMWGHWKDPH